MLPNYNLHEFAMMLAEVRPGSFIVTWFIPDSIVERLKAKVPREILNRYHVTKLEIDGVCVYLQKVSVITAVKSQGTEVVVSPLMEMKPSYYKSNFTKTAADYSLHTKSPQLLQEKRSNPISSPSSSVKLAKPQSLPSIPGSPGTSFYLHASEKLWPEEEVYPLQLPQEKASGAEKPSRPSLQDQPCIQPLTELKEMDSHSPSHSPPKESQFSTLL